MFFFLPEFNVVVFLNRQQFNARAGQKKNTCFFGNSQHKSNARAHLKQRRKHSGLTAQYCLCSRQCFFNVLKHYYCLHYLTRDIFDFLGPAKLLLISTCAKQIIDKSTSPKASLSYTISCIRRWLTKNALFDVGRVQINYANERVLKALVFARA